MGYSLCLEGTPDLCVVGTGAAGTCAITLVSTGQGRGGSRFRGDTGGRVSGPEGLPTVGERAGFRAGLGKQY